MQWDSQQYLKFNRQRTRPARDLAKRLAVKRPGSILDIGCGPGNSTSVLKEIFPQAAILGVDNSENMIKKAREACPDLHFRVCDITTGLDSLDTYDVIFSNACLQWIPDHPLLIPLLFSKLNKSGVLAVQMPMNEREMLFQIISEIVSEPSWGLSAADVGRNETLLPEEYFDILSSCTDHFELWETVYYHPMPSAEAMVEWVKGSRLRPYLKALDEAKAEQLEQEIVRRAAAAYGIQKNGEILFKFRRFFFTAYR